MKRNHILAIIGGAIMLVVLTAGAAAYMVSHDSDGTNAKAVPRTQKTIVYEQRAAAPPPACDDGNIVGHIIGGAAGGVAGSQVGSGSGQTAATIAGTLGGAYLGGTYIPARNVTCR